METWIEAIQSNEAYLFIIRPFLHAFYLQNEFREPQIYLHLKQFVKEATHFMTALKVKYKKFAWTNSQRQLQVHAWIWTMISIQTNLSNSKTSFLNWT